MNLIAIVFKKNVLKHRAFTLPALFSIPVSCDSKIRPCGEETEYDVRFPRYLTSVYAVYLFKSNKPCKR